MTHRLRAGMRRADFPQYNERIVSDPTLDAVVHRVLFDSPDTGFACPSWRTG